MSKIMWYFSIIIKFSLFQRLKKKFLMRTTVWNMIHMKG